MKVIIAGSRSFNDYDLLKKLCDESLHRYSDSDIEIVSGTARGADQLGERYAAESGYKLKKFPADWDLHGKGAGYIRNKQMANYADMLIAFWDGESRGTRHMLDLATEKGLKTHIVFLATFKNEKTSINTND